VTLYKEISWWEEWRRKGRPRQKLLDWMMEDEDGKKLKETAQQREAWNRWTFGPARRQMT